MQKLRRLLLALSGVREEILALCPTERVKFESLGWAILITSGLATVSMWFALSSALGVNGIIAVVPAAAWGLVIMGIDRWLITSMPIEGKRKFAIAAPRVVLAILLGTLISTPLVLRVFQSEINAQISVIKQSRYSTFLAEQQNSKVTQQVTTARNQVASLQKVIDSDGAAPLNPSADPQVQLLTSQLNKWLGLEQQYYKQWQCQLYGGSGCPKGNGPLAQSSHTNYLHAQSEVGTLQGEIQQRDGQLASSSTTEQKSRYDQAVTALPAAQQQLQVAAARQSALQANFYAQNQATNGILIRLQALSQLSQGDFTVTAARFLLFLLFLVIECLPVTVKILQQPGPYEMILLNARESELKGARRFYRNHSGIGMNSLPERGETPILQLNVEKEVDAHSIFSQTKVLPRPLGNRVDEEGTEVLGRHAPFQEQHPGGEYLGEPLRDDWPQDPYYAVARQDDQYPAETRHDYPYLGEPEWDEPHRGGHRREDRGPAEPRPGRHHLDTGDLPVVHQDLHDMEDRIPGGSDDQGGGIPLHWDDE